jgi:hypothetical protein
MAKKPYHEADETPGMEAEAHSKSFLKKAASMASGGRHTKKKNRFARKRVSK